MRDGKLRKIFEKLKEGKVFGEEMSHKIIVSLIFTVGLVLLVGISKHYSFDTHDFGKKIESVVPQIGFWYDKGICYSKEFVDSAAEIIIDPIVREMGMLFIIVILGAIIFKIRINKPDK